MKVINQIYFNNKLVHTDEFHVYPNLAADHVHRIDMTSTIEVLMRNERKKLLPPEGREEELAPEPHPG